MKSKISLLALGLALASGGPLFAQALPQTNLVASRDSFVIMVQGQPMGSSLFGVEVTPTGARITENTLLGAMGNQQSEMLTDVHGRISKLTQTGKFAGQDVNVSVDYANGRAKGKVVAPGKAPFDLDTEFPATALDENVMQAVLPGLPWAADAKWDIDVFSAGNNTVTKQSLVVKGTEQVTVPAGTFQAYRAEMSDGMRTVAFYIATDKAHRVLKIAPVGAPFELQLAK